MRILLTAVCALFYAGTAIAKGEGGGVFSFCYGQDVLFAYSVRFPEESPNSIFVATNFGILVSHDKGETYRWICPGAYGTSTNSDYTLLSLPGVAVVPDGSKLLVMTGIGYRASDDGGCSFDYAPDESLRAGSVVSVAFRPSAPHVIFASVSWPGTGPYGVYRSDNGGDSFSPTALIPEPDDIFFPGAIHLTEDAARLYTVTGNSDFSATVWRSEDLGDTWAAGASSDDLSGAFIAASHPAASETVYVGRVVSLGPACDPTFTLFQSDDGGHTLTERTQREDILVGTAALDDGSFWLAWKNAGLEMAEAGGDFVPVKGAPAATTCLAARTGSGPLVVCPSAEAPDLVRERDSKTGAFSTLVDFARVVGPIECPADSMAAKACEPAWPIVATYWGLGTGDYPLPDGGTGDGGDGGATDSDSEESKDAGPGSNDSRGGCSCDMGAAQDVTSAWLGVVLLLLLGRRRWFLAASCCLGCAVNSDAPPVEDIEWGLSEDQAWQDTRDYPGIGAGRILITNNLDDTVSIIDLKSVASGNLAELVRVPVGFIPVEREGPHHVAAALNGEHYYVAISNYVPGSGSGPHGVHGTGTADGYALKIRASDNLQVDSVRVDRSPGDIRVTPDGRTLLVSHFDLMRITDTIQKGGDPADMDSFLAIVDAETMVLQSMVRLCPGSHGLAIAPDSATGFVSCLSDEIAIVDLAAPDKDATRVPVLKQPGSVESPVCYPYAMTIAPAGDAVWVSCFNNGQVLCYDVEAAAMDPNRTAQLPGPATFGTFTEDGSALLIPHQLVDGIAFIDPKTGEILDDIALPRAQCENPHVVRLTDDEQHLMVVCEGNRNDPGTFLSVNRSTGKIEQELALGRFPDDLAILTPAP